MTLGGHLLGGMDWIEQLPAQLGQQSDGRDRLLHAPPATAGPVEHRPHQAQAGPLAGEPADDLYPTAGLAEGALDEVGVADAGMVLGREAQVGNEVLEVVLEAVDGRRVELAPLRGERPGPVAGGGLGAVPGSASMSSKVFQYSA